MNEESMDQNKKRKALWIGGGIVLAAVVAATLFVLLDNGQIDEAHDHEGEVTYYCPMHPQVTSPEPGICPICNMDLVPQGEEDAMEEHLESIEGVTITERGRIIADVGTVEATFRLIGSDISAPAVVEFNEGAESSITAWFPGRIDRLYIDKTGQSVRKGQPIAEIYSPQLITAQQEYLLALRAANTDLLPSFNGDDPSSTTRAEAGLVDAAADRLELLGMNPPQIDRLRNEQTVQRTTTIYSTATGVITTKGVREGGYVNAGTLIAEVVDLSSVWVIASVPEAEAERLRTGMPMQVSDAALDVRRNGRVDYIYPVVDPQTRTVQVRGLFQNGSGDLRPGSYVTAHFPVGQRDVLAVPISAVIRTGERNLVYVEVDDGSFEAREVELGMKSDGFFEIRSGDVSVGDRVVAEGGYLLDAERQLRTPGQSESHSH